ncbi:MAG: aminoglycoside phosphotransferase family protein [Puniceicoccales bacterium]|jgi:thiamine kinase-like enzyme|nr:aminoglycoside phosphotransferase family protein [Puniceicoccales bacterium]
MKHDIRSIFANFNIPGDFVSASPHGNGHINDTYAITCDQGASRLRYIIQRVNHNVFKDAASVMKNTARICRHSRDKLREEGIRDTTRRTLTLVPTNNGADWFVDASGNHWRCFLFIERARSYDIIENTGQAYEAARTFGTFTRLLADLPGERLVEVIPNFHNTRKRYENFQKTLAADSLNRATKVKAEIAFLQQRETDCSVVVDAIAQGKVPERVTHNDTKLNNILLDDYSQQGLCVIDLDTAMPGSALYDFGDMVRSATTPTSEDETDLARVVCRQEYFEALARGYLDALGDTLNTEEKHLLAFSGKLLTLEVGMRFLTDYLAGDTYFKIAHPEHNLERCRNQFALVASIERQLDAMNALVEKLLH